MIDCIIAVCCELSIVSHNRSLPSDANALCFGLRDSLSRPFLEGRMEALLSRILQAILYNLLVLRYIPDDESISPDTGKGASLEDGYNIGRLVSGSGTHIHCHLLSWLSR